MKMPTSVSSAAGGKGSIIRFAVGECDMGSVLVAASGKGVCAILLGDVAEDLISDLAERFPTADLVGDDEHFNNVVPTVVGFIQVPGRGLNLPLDVRGTVFQRQVWRALMEVPAGSTASYKEIAERIGLPKAARAVAQACAANPIAVAVPCHRIVRQDGGLSGYRWGLERKRVLLARETID